ncbi:hypothetical protein [Actinokineospora alba]|nr:hypothetical protein [Actinokineospora alba]
MSVELRDLAWSKITVERHACEQRAEAAGDESEKLDAVAPADDR